MGDSSVKRIFFLGAGFSAHAGFPLGNNMLNFMEQNLHEINVMDKHYLSILRDIIEVYNKSNLGFFTDNLELLLTSLTLFDTYTKSNPILDELKKVYKRNIATTGDDKYYFPQHFISRIAHGVMTAFKNYHMSISNLENNSSVEGKSKKTAYSKFFDMLDENDSIITVNYDVICEQELWRRNKWTPLDGYGFRKTKDSLDLHVGPEQSAVKVYKLHGSINWAESNIARGKIMLTDLPIYFKDFKGKYTENDERGASIANVLILPNYLQSFIQHKAMLKVWNIAEEILLECEKLYFIGYSLSDIDCSLQLMLCNAIEKNSNLRKNKISVINNCNMDLGENLLSEKHNVFIRYQQLFGNYSCECKKESFERWINTKT